MTNCQAAAHESWLVRCFAPSTSFIGEKSASVPLILQESADATCTQPCYPFPPSFLHANFVPIKENIVGSSGELNQGFPQIFSCYQHSSGLILDILHFPVAAQFIFLCPNTPQYLAKSIQQVDRADTFGK